MSTGTATQSRRYFRSHESARSRELDGLPLATFGQRVLGYAVDLVIAVLIWAPAEFAWRDFVLHERTIRVTWDFHEFGNVIVLVLYSASPIILETAGHPGSGLRARRLFR